MSRTWDTDLHFPYLVGDMIGKGGFGSVFAGVHIVFVIMERPLFSKDLFQIISEQQNLDEKLAKCYFKQVVETVMECHKHGVIHKDIKSENIVVDLVTNKTRLIDFGSGDFLQREFYTKFDGDATSTQ